MLQENTQMLCGCKRSETSKFVPMLFFAVGQDIVGF